MRPAPTAPPAAPAKKATSRGCLIALLVLGGLAGLACLVGGLVLWRASKDPDLQKVMGALGKGADLVMKGAKAPGAAELRAAGCEQALVLPLGEMLALASEFVDAGSLDDAAVGMAITCTTKADLGAPTCEKLAKVYVKAAAPTAPFMLSVQSMAESKSLCDVTFDASGEPQAR
jgi:hypothetical protein